MEIHRAPWVLPMSGPPVADGAVVCADGKIIACGPWARLREQEKFSGPVHEHPDRVLMPGLVNAHTHLELSHLSHLAATAPSSFTGWVNDLVHERDRLGYTGAGVEEAARAALDRFQAQGVAVVADIGNTEIGARVGREYPGLVLPLLEFLGLRGRSRRQAEARLRELGPDIHCTAHAPYTTHFALMTAIKDRCRRYNSLFSIHVAESLSETELLLHDRGELKEFLLARNFFDPGYRPPGIDIKGPVQYVGALGLLDARTLCVHGVHVSDREMALLRAAGSSVCLCPGSNRFLGVGTPPLARYLAAGVNLALGTDSAASNPDLSLWREMRLLAEQEPATASEKILEMATVGGARALGVARRFGSLAPGRAARFLAVAIPRLDSGTAVTDWLVRADNPAVYWIG